MRHVIETMAGVVLAQDPAGSVTVSRDEQGDTVVTLQVWDATVNEVATVYLDQAQAVRLILALGAVTVDL